MCPPTDDTESGTDESDSTPDDSVLTTALRTVTPPFGSRPDTEMTALGWGSLALLVVLFVPFLPVVVAVWLVVRLIELLTDGG